VQIVMAALVLGRQWTWIVTALSVGGYAFLFLGSTEELRAAQSMHPEIALHMRGMWLAFAVTALIVAALVTRLAIAVERRDRALAVLRDEALRTGRMASLATLAAGAAHELSTPLSTIAVAAHELERGLSDHDAGAELQRDALLIRTETDRCRRILEAIAGRAGEPPGDTPRETPLGDIAAALADRLPAADRARLHLDVPAEVHVVWPVQVVARALANVVQNALQASSRTDSVAVSAAVLPGRRIRLSVVDRGCGMSSDALSRAGEPFFTTKPAGVGTGLGLFVTRSSVEQLGGTLELTSVPGRGTTATITLPQDVIAHGARAHG
jgi:two-component system sensor histidine kinase RegB